MKVTTDPAKSDAYETQGFCSSDWLTTLAILRKQLAAAAVVFPYLKDYKIERTEDTPKKK